jgi:hypothetical protein
MKEPERKFVCQPRNTEPGEPRRWLFWEVDENGLCVDDVVGEAIVAGDFKPLPRQVPRRRSCRRVGQ